jgi:hypothetical protein
LTRCGSFRSGHRGGELKPVQEIEEKPEKVRPQEHVTTVHRFSG